MSSDEKEGAGRIVKIVILSVVLAIVVILIITFAIVELVKFHKKNNPTPPTPPKQEEVEQPKDSNVFTNAYNEAIAKKMLTDDAYDYVGDYIFDRVSTIYFNENVTREERLKFLQDNGCKDVNSYAKKITDEMRPLFENIHLQIDKPINDATGKNESYGTYVYTTPDETLTGKVYGDRNLAVLVKDNTDDQEYWFISLNYDNTLDAINVSDKTVEEDETIYLFVNHYKDGKLFYSLTYVFKWK